MHILNGTNFDKIGEKKLSIFEHQSNCFLKIVRLSSNYLFNCFLKSKHSLFFHVLIAYIIVNILLILKGFHCKIQCTFHYINSFYFLRNITYRYAYFNRTRLQITYDKKLIFKNIWINIVF